MKVSAASMPFLLFVYFILLYVNISFFTTKTVVQACRKLKNYSMMNQQTISLVVTAALARRRKNLTISCPSPTCPVVRKLRSAVPIPFILPLLKLPSTPPLPNCCQCHPPAPLRKLGSPVACSKHHLMFLRCHVPSLLSQPLFPKSQ